MKKSFRRSVLASTVLLAIAGSIIGCAQSVTPQIDKTKTNTKDIYEKQLATPSIVAKSYFGMNLIEFSDVNYADDYVMYRFGPTGEFETSKDGVYGKLIKTPTSKETFDGYRVEDKVETSNPMIAGTYTYRLIAKSEVNSARAMADLSNKTPGNTAANQDYWANPKVDVSWLPAIAEASVSVSKTNMPEWGTKMPSPKPLVEGKDYRRGTTKNSVITTTEKGDLNTFYFNPTLKVSKVYAVVDGLNDCFENSINNTNTTNFFIEMADNKLTLPDTYTHYKLYAYNIWDDATYYPNSDKVVIKEGVPYNNPTVRVDVKWASAAYTDKKTSEEYPFAINYTLDNKVPASNYRIITQRAEITQEKITQQTYVSKVTDVVLTEVGKDITDATTKYYLVDKTALPGKKYMYFVGGTYGDTGRIDAATFESNYVMTDSTKTVSELNATLITKLPTVTDLYREKVTGEIKFMIADDEYTNFKAERITEEAGVKTITDITSKVVKTENLGNTYIHFVDTLDWNKAKTAALVPTYKFTYTKNYTNYTSAITFRAEGTSPVTDTTKLMIYDINDKSSGGSANNIQVQKLKVNDKSVSESESACVVDTYRYLYKVNAFDSVAVEQKDTTTFTVKYKVGATKANNGQPNDQTLAKVPTTSGIDYYINYLVKDSVTGQTWKKDNIKVPTFGSVQTFEIPGLEKNTKYDVVLTLSVKLLNEKGIEEIMSIGNIGDNPSTNTVTTKAN